MSVSQANMNRILCRHSMNRLISSNTLHPLLFSYFCTETNQASANSNPNTSESHRQDDIVESGDYHQKYRTKIQHLKKSNPEEYAKRLSSLETLKMKEHNDRIKDLTTPPDATSSSSFTEPNKDLKQWPPKSLDSILNMDMVNDLPAQNIEKIWADYHSTRDCLFSVIKEEDFDDINVNSSRFPLFVYPLPRQDGFEFMVSMFSNNNCYFVPLGAYQKSPESAQPILTLAHFTDFKSSKGIVLMTGHYDQQTMQLGEAVNLSRQMSSYYSSKAGTTMYNLLDLFNNQPQTFDYTSVIEQYKHIKSFVESISGGTD